MKNGEIATRVRTGKVRLSYANVWNAKAQNEGDKPVFSTSVIIPKSDRKTLDAIEKAIEAAYKEGEAKLKGNARSVPALSTLKTPLRDGDLERPDDEAYKDSYFLNAKSYRAPEIVDQDREPILDHGEVYSGVYVRLILTFYAFNNQSKGIACGLGNIQKLADGEPLGGGTRAVDDFADDDDYLS